MPTNVNVAGGPSIQPTSRASETKTDRIAVNKDGGSSSGFAKQTDVKFTNSVANMSAVLEKISASRLGADNALPKQLQQMINNIVRQAFSLDSSLGEGLGSAMASERYSIEQLTALSRIFQQMGSFANSQAVEGELANMQLPAGELSDELQALMTNLKTLMGEGGLVDKSSSLELVQLNKLAFQLLNDGNAERLPQDLVQLLQLLSSQNTMTGAQVQGNEQQSALKELINALFPKPLTPQGTGSGQAMPNTPAQANQAYAAQQNQVMQGGAAAVGNTGTGTSSNGTAANNSQLPTMSTVPANQAQSMSGAAVLNNANSATNAAAANNAGTVNTVSTTNSANAANAASAVNSEVQVNTAQTADNADKSANNPAQNTMSNVPNRLMVQAAEIENNPLFKQIFSRYGYSQETGVVRQTVQQTAQPQMELANNQQTVSAFKDLAQLLLKDSQLTSKDTQLLQNFVNGQKDALTQQDAKQLNLLLRMVQSNVPAAVQQAGQQQGMDGLPKLWAFLQLSELGTLKDIRAKDLKEANKEIKTMVSSMKNAITSEGSYKADGQKSISFVMPLYIGENEQSYPAYINIYDEPEHEDERGRMRRDTWFRVCVLTDNIGAVDVVCQLFEGNNLNLRVCFSSQEAVQEFSEYLPDVRKALYDTSIHLNDLKVGTVS